MTEASSEDEGYVTRPRDWRQIRRQKGIDNGPNESTTTTEVPKKEYKHKDYKNDNG